jgi:hypothetical protein
MADINLLSGDDEGKTAKGGSASGGKNGKNGVSRPASGDEMRMYVPPSQSAKPVEKPSAVPASPAKPVPPPPVPDSILKQKIQPLSALPLLPKPPSQLPPKLAVPVPPPPRPIPPVPPQPPKPVVPVPPPAKLVVPAIPRGSSAKIPLHAQNQSPLTPSGPKTVVKDEGATLRVSLITTGAGASFSEIALRRRLGSFALIGLIGLVIDGLIFGGLLYWKSKVEERNIAAEGDVRSIDEQIAVREKELEPVRQFQQLLQAESKVIDDHAHWTGVLKLLEETALPDVQFGSLAGADSGALSFEVFSRDYTTMAKQIVAFRHDPRVLKAGTGTATADFGDGNLLRGVRADMTLSVDPKIFKFDAGQATGSAPVPATTTLPPTTPATAPPPTPVTNSTSTP